MKKSKRFDNHDSRPNKKRSEKIHGHKRRERNELSSLKYYY
jgi:hypothetical protein